MLREKDASLRDSMLNHPDFLEIFTSGRYHRDMTILKILASNFKQFRVCGIFKTLQIDDDKGGQPNTTIS